MKSLFWRILILVCAASVGQSAHATILYDGSLGTTLNQQGWIYLTDPLFGADAQYSLVGEATQLDSTPTMGDSAGFFSYSTVDTQTDYSLQFTVAVPTETHSSTHRAGFSVLVVGEDYGSIELGFWTNEIWAQSGPNSLDASEALFTHAETSGTVDTMGMTSYELRVVDDSYSLWSGGTELLSGLLRDYSSHSHPVYSMPNTIFVGDDTGSASTVAEISSVAFTTSVPEPGVLVLLVAVGVAGCMFRHRRSG